MFYKNCWDNHFWGCLPEKQDVNTAAENNSSVNTTLPWTPIAKLTLPKPCPNLIDTAKLMLVLGTSNKEFIWGWTTINYVTLPGKEAVSNNSAFWNAREVKSKNKSTPHKIVIPDISGWPALRSSQQLPSAIDCRKRAKWKKLSPSMTLLLDNRFQPLLS